MWRFLVNEVWNIKCARGLLAIGLDCETENFYRQFPFILVFLNLCCYDCQFIPVHVKFLSVYQILLYWFGAVPYNLVPPI